MTTRPTPLTIADALRQRSQEHERQELRCYDMAAFQRLDDRRFTRLLSRACEEDLLPEAFAAEVVRRAGAGQLRTRALRSLLLDSAIAPQRARPIQQAVWVALALTPARATAVLISQVQTLEAVFLTRALPAGEGTGRFGVQAGWRTPGRFVHGLAVYADQRKTAQHRAALSLLGHLSQVQPVAQEAGDGAHWTPVGASDAYVPVTVEAPADDFLAELRRVCAQAVVAPAMVAEVTARVHAGALDPRALHLVLFQATAPQWESARRAVIDAIAAKGGPSATILNIHANALGQPAPVYEDVTVPDSTKETPRFATRASYDPGTGAGGVLVSSGPMRTRKHSRRAAATALLAKVTGLPLAPHPGPPAAASPSGRPTPNPPVSALNELAQVELISGLAFDVSTELTGAQSLFSCQAVCRSKGRDLQAAGEGLSKSAAREQAARALLALVVADDEPVPVAPGSATSAREMSTVKPVPAGKDPLGVLNSLRQTGAIADVDPQYETSGLPHRQVFTCTLSCLHQGQTLTALGHAANKRASYQEAARALIACLALIPARPVPEPDAAPTAQESQAAPAEALLVPPPRTARTQPLAASPAQTAAAVRLMEEVLRAGAAISADLSPGLGAARLLIYRPDGSPLPDLDPALPVHAENVELVLPGTGVALRAQPISAWTPPLRLLAGVLARLPETGLHPSAATWRAVTRLGLDAIASQRVYPGSDQGGRDAWQLGPLTAGQRAVAAGLSEVMPPYAHCVPAARAPYRLWAPRIVVRHVLDALADAIVRGPGTSAVLGAAPYTTPTGRPHSPDVVAWTDRLTTILDPVPPPNLVLTIKPPPSGSPHDTELLWAVLRVQTTTPGGQVRLVDAAEYLPNRADLGELERVRRALRGAARVWPPLARLLEQHHPARCTVHAAEAALLLGERGHELARAGIEIVWPGQWARAVGIRAVIGVRSTREAAFGLDNVLDFRWQLTLDGNGLSEEEMDALAADGRALVHLRGQWLLLSEQNARRAAARGLGTLPAAEALTAALTGSLTVDGDRVACEPVDALADLVEFLRVGTHQPVPASAALTASLRDYQQRALAWLANLTGAGFGACLGDDMGLGKSITAIALHLHRREQVERAAPTLIVCPASLLVTWEREFAAFAPSVRVRRYHGQARSLQDLSAQEVVITTYGTLQRDADLLTAQPFGLLIADEAQQVKHHLSLTARTLRRLNGKARVALTGTPVENSVMEAWSILDWANPGLFGSPRTFAKRYARPIEHDPDSEHARRLSRVLAPFLLRRRKSDPHILTELPPKITTRRCVPLTREQVGLYEAVARETMERIHAAQTGERSVLVLTLLTQLRQICNTPAHYLRETPPLQGYDSVAERHRSGKLGALDDVLANVIAAGEQALVFTGYAAMGRLLETHLRAQGIEPLFLHGKVPPGQARQDLVDAFQTGRNPVMILTLGAGGTGLTLTEAAHAIMFDRPWNPAVETQAIDRAHRIGQGRALEVHLLQTELTIEDRIDALLARKRALADAVLTSRETLLGDLTDSELVELIALGARS
ncbi:SNF2-related protein [Nonomuraea sp. NPDC050540]|uniref:SNF2-related protein n=1 Tax=Nonomuraea sp. NPDC050540 TaxID=3364367 RepID=UPI0037B7A553